MHKKLVLAVVVYSFALSNFAFATAGQTPAPAVAKPVASPAAIKEVLSYMPPGEAMAFMDVQRAIGETLPGIFGVDSAAMTKVRLLLAGIKSEEGIDPNELDLLAAGLPMERPSGSTPFVIMRGRFNSPALIDSVYQVNRSKQELMWLKQEPHRRILQMTIDLTLLQSFTEQEHATELKAMMTSVDEAKGLVRGIYPAGKDPITPDLTATGADLAKFAALVPTDSNQAQGFQTRLNALQKELEAVTAGDDRRTSKILDIDARISRMQLEVAQAMNVYHAFNTGDPETLVSSTKLLLGQLNTKLTQLPKATVARRRALPDVEETAKYLRTATTGLLIGATIQHIQTHKKMSMVEFPTDLFVRRDENYAGRKLIIFVARGPEAPAYDEDPAPITEMPKETTVETSTAFGVIDDHTIVRGDPAIVREVLDTVANGGKHNADLIETAMRDKQAVIGFAAKFKVLDNPEGDLLDRFDSVTSKKAGEVWQLSGSLVGGPGDLSLNAGVAKDQWSTSPGAPVAPGQNAAKSAASAPVTRMDDLMSEIFDSFRPLVVGVEGQLKLKFSAPKVAALLDRISR